MRIQLEEGQITYPDMDEVGIPQGEQIFAIMYLLPCVILTRHYSPTISFVHL